MKNYIGFSRDHSGSMRGIAEAAAKDYNDNIVAVRDAAIDSYLDTIVSVVECGHGDTSEVRRVAVNSSVTFLRPLGLDEYSAKGSGTPLWDSVGDLIEIFQQVPDRDDPNVSFLVMAVTDGAENASRKWSTTSLGRKIRELQNTDRWTFVFRVPKGHRSRLYELGVHEGNILEWDQSVKGVEISTQATRQAVQGYYRARASGQRSTNSFYADLSQVTPREVKQSLKEISSEVLLWPVGTKDDGEWISHFVERRLPGESYLKGAAFYQLTKSETVQDHKRIMVREKKSGGVYEGYAARRMLNLPDQGSVRLRPGDHGGFDLFIQSTSYNRHLVAGTSMVYWKGFMRAAA